MPEAIKYGAASIDLSERVFRTGAVVASPAAAAETIVASLTIAADLAVMEGILLAGFGAYTVGTAGVSVNLRIRRTNVTGTIIKATGAMTRAAAALDSDTLVTFDTGPSLPNQVYVLTATVASASAETTFSAVELIAVVV
jgi:hypothetical protein